MRVSRRWTAIMAAMLAAGAAARLAVLVGLDPRTWVQGSDTTFYLRQGWLLAHGVSPLFADVAPAYTWLVAAAWRCCSTGGGPGPPDIVPASVLTALRLVQVACSLGMVWAAAVLARRWSGSGRAAIATSVGLALSPAFVLEPFRPLTETVFLLLLYLGLLLWSSRERGSPGAQVAPGVVFGLAALVRPVVIGLPVILAAWQWFAGDGARGRRRAAVLFLGMAATLAPWSVSLHRHTGSWLPRGLAANLWIGAVGDGRWHGQDATDALRDRFAAGPDAYVGETVAVIRKAPVHWLLIRARNLGAALAQPHFASEIPGSSTRLALAHWWRDEGGPRALLSLLCEPSVLLKLALYATHWLALVAGVAGLLRWRRQWRELFGLWAIVLYFPCVHVFLTALPRYLLPIQPALWIAVALAVQRPPDAAETMPAAPQDAAV